MISHQYYPISESIKYFTYSYSGAKFGERITVNFCDGRITEYYSFDKGITEHHFKLLKKDISHFNTMIVYLNYKKIK
jgi:hypothetical protein